MKLEMFAIFDVKANAFIPPFFLPTPAMAVRVFTDSCNDPQHMFCKHAEDYTLMHMGTFDDATGFFEIKQTPAVLGLGITFRREQKPLDFDEIERDGKKYIPKPSDLDEIKYDNVPHFLKEQAE